MKSTLRTLTAAAAVLASSLAQPLVACTNILVTKGASKDGATMISYAADSHTLYGELYYKAGAQHLAGEMRDIVDWDSGKLLGRVKEAPVTYTRVGNMNEFQVVIGETTFGGRKELQEPAGIVDYGSLMYMALERAKTAREAIQVMGQLVEEYGYASEGESISVGDVNEAWIFDIIGKGKGQKGAVWVAVRVPDGTISAHANHSRISQFPLHDPANCIYSPDVVSFARANGWYKGEDKDFSFNGTYAPADFGALRFCEARVWSVFHRAAPSLNLPIDVAKGVKDAKPLPLFVKPDRKLGVHDVMELMRDHYEGTELDMTKDIGAGPYHTPYRWRPMEWKVDGKDYLHERAISTQQTGWSYVSQSRGYLPNPIGGVLWFGVDDTYSTVYVPQYCANKAVPHSFAEGTGSWNEFSWDSAFWTFNFVANYAYSRYDDMIGDIQKVQRELEGNFLANQAGVEEHALALYKQSPLMARDYLTEYSCTQGEMVTRRWRKLGEFLIWKYLDGNVRDSKGEVTHPAYPQDWYRRIVNDKGEAIRIPEGEAGH
jgi:dipeptidase